jgi:hypothetical protein
MPTTPGTIRRAPTGVVTNKPIPVRLLPDELQQLKGLAHREQRSLASVCRLALLQGLKQYARTGELL